MKKHYGVIYLLLFILIAAHVSAQPTFLKIIPSDSKNFKSAFGKLFFTRGDSLFRSDGTPSGTVFVKEMGEPFYEFTNLTVGSFFYFTTLEAGGNVALWKSNGYANNTFKIRSAPTIKPLITYNGSLYIGMYQAATGYELWRVTSGNAFTLVKDIYPGVGSGLGDEIIVANSLLYFKGNDGGITGINLWKSNGTSITSLAVDFSFNNFTDLTAVNNIIYFHREYTTLTDKKAEIWKTNGTQVGTSMVKQFSEEDPEFCNLYLNNLISYNNKLYFDLLTGCGLVIDNLYTSDGTTTGTVLVKTINLDGYVSDFFTVNNRIVFYGSSQGFPGSLSRSNGTAAGTQVFHNMNSEPPRAFATVGNLLFFADHTESNFGAPPIDPDNYFQLYQSGLEASNTETLRDIFGVSFAGSNNLTDANGKLFFTTYNDHPSIPVGDRVMKLYYYTPIITAKMAAAPETSEVEFSAYPNPSDEKFYFSVKSKSTNTATADIYKIDGTLVTRVLETEAQEGETVEFNWNGIDLPGGVYFCKYTCGSESVVKRIVLKK